MIARRASRLYAAHRVTSVQSGFDTGRHRSASSGWCARKSFPQRMVMWEADDAIEQDRKEERLGSQPLMKTDCALAP